MNLNSILYKRRMSPDQMIVLTTSLSYMISAGMSVRKAVDLLIKDPSNKLNQTCLKAMRDGFDSGETLAQVFKEHEDMFGEGLWEQIEVAQRTGRQPEALMRIADQIKMNRGISGRIKGAMAYPCLVLVMAAVAGYYLLTHTIPEMGEMMADLGGEMPAMTLAMMHLCDALLEHGLLIAMLLVCIALLVRWLLKYPLKHQWHRFASKAPLAGSIIVDMSYARAYIMINDMIANGSNAVDSLKIASTTITNKFISGELYECARDMEREGHSIAQALQSATSMPSDDKLMLSVGQETGREMEILQDLTKHRSEKAQASVNRLLEMMSPIIMLFVCAIVGVVVVSVYMPMLTMASQFS